VSAPAGAARLSVPGPRSPSRAEKEKKELRRRLVEGMVAAIEERGATSGYSAVTIADVVRHAQMSKRSFYEFFQDKDDCLLATYRGLSELTIRGIEAAFVHAESDSNTDWEARIHAAANAYVTTLALRPLLTRTFLLEIHTAGGAGLEVRRAVHLRFANLLERLVELARKDNPAMGALTRSMAIAMVGGINELVLVSLESHKDEKLSGVADAVTEFVRRVLMLGRGA
jgi:AcrR family transcriptional regulator